MKRIKKYIIAVNYTDGWATSRAVFSKKTIYETIGHFMSHGNIRNIEVLPAGCATLEDIKIYNLY